MDKYFSLLYTSCSFLIFCREDTKTETELDKPITAILHEEDALDYDEFDEEKNEGNTHN